MQPITTMDCCGSYETDFSNGCGTLQTCIFFLKQCGWQAGLDNAEPTSQVPKHCYNVNLFRNKSSRSRMRPPPILHARGGFRHLHDCFPVTTLVTGRIYVGPRIENAGALKSACLITGGIFTAS
jgi:hypothetical protein